LNVPFMAGPFGDEGQRAIDSAVQALGFVGGVSGSLSQGGTGAPFAYAYKDSRLGVLRQ
jgi:hypothetical protein